MERINEAKHYILKQILKEKHLDAVLLISKINRLWYTGLSCSWGYLLVMANNSILIVDERYEEIAKTKVTCSEIAVLKVQNFFEKFGEIIKNNKIKEIGIDDTTDLGFFELLKNKMNFLKLNWTICATSQIRIVKDTTEIEQIRKVCAITNRLFVNLKKAIRPGITSERDLERMVYEFILDNDLDKVFPEPIINSGTRTSEPHGHPTNRVICFGDPVTIDLGVVRNGFYSDMTRTFLVGQPSEKIAKIYEIVLKANLAAIENCKPGIKACDLDHIARSLIASYGYGEQFLHQLGHGIGYLVHEAPRLASYCQTVLQPGMVVTIEPGIYLPKIGGVRIEDDILITRDGYEVLTDFPKDLKAITIK